ncbi:MAG: hypothetical protein ACRC9V_12840, partial [Aeromonas sp.]
MYEIQKKAPAGAALHWQCEIQIKAPGGAALLWQFENSYLFFDPGMCFAFKINWSHADIQISLLIKGVSVGNGNG